MKAGSSDSYYEDPPGFHWQACGTVGAKDGTAKPEQQPRGASDDLWERTLLKVARGEVHARFILPAVDSQGDVGNASKLIVERGGLICVHARGKLGTPALALGLLHALEAQLEAGREKQVAVHDLDMAQNKFSVEYLAALLGMLAASRVQVQRLRFYGSKNVGDLAMRALAEYLGCLDKEAVPLELHLSDCAITSQGFNSLMRGIAGNSGFPYRYQKSGVPWPLYLRVENNYISSAAFREWSDSEVMKKVLQKSGFPRPSLSQQTRVHLLVLEAGISPQKHGKPTTKANRPTGAVLVTASAGATVDLERDAAGAPRSAAAGGPAPSRQESRERGAATAPAATTGAGTAKGGCDREAGEEAPSPPVPECSEVGALAQAGAPSSGASSSGEAFRRAEMAARSDGFAATGASSVAKVADVVEDGAQAGSGAAAAEEQAEACLGAASSVEVQARAGEGAAAAGGAGLAEQPAKAPASAAPSSGAACSSGPSLRRRPEGSKQGEKVSVAAILERVGRLKAAVASSGAAARPPAGAAREAAPPRPAAPPAAAPRQDSEAPVAQAAPTPMSFQELARAVAMAKPRSAATRPSAATAHAAALVAALVPTPSASSVPLAQMAPMAFRLPTASELAAALALQGWSVPESLPEAVPPPSPETSPEVAPAPAPALALPAELGHARCGDSDELPEDQERRARTLKKAFKLISTFPDINCCIDVKEEWKEHLEASEDPVREVLRLVCLARGLKRQGYFDPPPAAPEGGAAPPPAHRQRPQQLAATWTASWQHGSDSVAQVAEPWALAEAASWQCGQPFMVWAPAADAQWAEVPGTLGSQPYIMGLAGDPTSWSGHASP